MVLVLASASPRRAELLRQINVPFSVEPARIDETRLANESPEQYVLRLAREKAAVVHDRLGRGPVLGSDTSVVLGNKIFGKPNDVTDFTRMFMALSGGTHQVMSAVAVVDAEKVETAISVTEVCFRTLSAADIENYWHTGEPLGKAGGYAIQGIAATFVAHIKGSYSGVMGLPLFETAALLETFGVIQAQ